MTVANPDAAIADPDFKSAVEESIADTANTNKSYVSATLSKVTTRRLGESLERRLGTAVHVDYTITLPGDQVTSAQASQAHAALTSVTSTALTSTLNTKLASASGNYTVSVTEITAPTLDAPTTTLGKGSSNGGYTNQAKDPSFMVFVLIGISSLMAIGHRRD
jgi:ABC-type Na+ efflux pump permease subunit